MVYTVTLNPALDLSAPAAPASGGAARYGQGDFIAGGKGINVSWAFWEALPARR